MKKTVPEFIGDSGQEIFIGFDYDLNKRGDKWTIGPFEYGTDFEKAVPEDVVFQDPAFIISHTAVEEEIKVPEQEMPEKGTVVYEEKFANQDALKAWTVDTGNWVLQGGRYLQTDETILKAVTTYNDGYWWSDYECSVDLVAPSGEVENFTGLLLRVSPDHKDLYAIRMATGGIIEFVMWYKGAFVSLAKWKFDYTPGFDYNLKVTAIGNEITCYVNDKEIGKKIDNTHARGSVGFYTYTKESRQGGDFDNLKVTSMKQD